MSHDLSSTDFDEKVLESKGLVIVDFWAVWCPPCRALTPMLEKIAEDLKDKVTVYKLNVDENQELSIKYQILSIPTVKYFKDGKEVASIIGLESEHTYRSLIDKHA